MQTIRSQASPPLRPELSEARAITFRSVLLGLCGVVLICGLTPYNDYALNNTFLVGNNLPLGVIMLTFLFALLVNGPLSRFYPAWTFSSGEIAVAFSMTLVSCALPSSGLMRYFPGSLVGPFWHARGNAEYLSLLQSLNLPRWIFPGFRGNGPADWMNDPIVTDFMGRTPEGESPPYWAWVTPAVTWGVFLFALYGALLCMVTLVRRQWFENERLPFPLAQIQLALVEQPGPRRFLNDSLARRTFWIAFAAVFILHLWNGLQNYYPEHFPRIWVYYDFSRLFTEPPYKYVDQKLKDAAIFFTAVGVTYYLSTPVAFSLWFFFILQQVYKMALGTWMNDANLYGTQDEHLGGVFAFALTVLWVGRHQWRLVLAQAFRGERPGEARGRYLSYPFAFWGFVGCAAIMCGWLWLAGCTLIGAIVLVMLLLLLFFIIARIIAETGIIHGQLQVPMYKPWQLLAMYGWPRAVPMETFYHSAMLQDVHYDFREIVPVYASHGLKLTDQTIFDRAGSTADRKTGRRIIGLLMLSLLVGYVVSFGSTLWTEYHYAWTRDVAAISPINSWGANSNPYGQIMGASVQYQKSNYHPVHSPIGHIGAGFIITAVLAFLRLTYTWWPLHPIGFLMLGTFPAAHLWFSIMIGWLCKVLILRFGGARMYLNAKPFFLGLIVGESAAAGFWLMMGIALSTLGIPYRPVNIMPG